MSRETREAYRRTARWHELFVWILTLGIAERLRREMVDRLGLSRGSRVLDLGCGMGENFLFIEEFIGEAGNIIGVDRSSDMLVLARENLEGHGLTNVVLVEASLADYRPDEQVDAVISTFALGLVSDYRRVLRNAVGALRPGGCILIADARFSDRWYSPILNPFLRMIAGLIPGSYQYQYLESRPWEYLEELLGTICYEEQSGGALYIAWGRTTE